MNQNSENLSIQQSIDKQLDGPLNQFFEGNKGNDVSREMLIGLKYFIVQEMLALVEKALAIKSQSDISGPIPGPVTPSRIPDPDAFDQGPG